MPNGVDKELVKLVQQGDRQAFDQLVEKYHSRIVKLVSRYVRDPSEALDVAQESFIKAYRALSRFRGDSAFYTWLYRIAINTAKNHVVMQNRKIIDANVEILDIEQTLHRGQNDYKPPEFTLINSELEEAVMDVIQELPKDLKTTITLREMDGLTYEEIAGVMDCPIGTVRSRIFRARETIERRMRPVVRRSND